MDIFLSQTPTQISPDLKWKEHINNISGKASSTLEKSKTVLQRMQKTTYIALVRSILEYGAIIWDLHTKSDINKLKIIQRSGARFVQNYKSREDGCIRRLLDDLVLPTLETRRKQQRLIFFFKVIEGQILASQPDLFNKCQPEKRNLRAKNAAREVYVTQSNNIFSCYKSY